jgi:hypothetical protein
MNAISAQVDVLRGWSHMSGFSTENRDWTTSMLKPRRPRLRVTISEHSTMLLYHLDEKYSHAKSYSKEDYNFFQRFTLIEAVRIKRLVPSTPSGESAKSSVLDLLKKNVVSIDEVTGIEHLVLRNSPSMVAQERKDHVKAVLSEQRQMGRSKRDTDKLAAFSASSSLRSSKYARIRGAMAALR